MSDPFSGEFWANLWEFWIKHSESVRNLALTVAAILAGTIGTFLAIRRTTAANRSSWAADEQAKTGVQSHITQNFTKAVEQLGSDKLDVRLGGIYALARIAQDSERDYWPIMQTLTAYVRERRPRFPATPSSETEESRIIDARGAPFSVLSVQPDTHSKSETTRPKLPADIQSVLAVLGSRKHEYEKPHQIPNLGYTDLRGLVLRPGENHLGCVTLIHTDLSEANLIGADLRGANLGGANLTGASLSETNFSGAILMADLRRAYFGETDLNGADLTGADFTGAIYLTCEQLTRAKNWESAGRDTTLACGADIPQKPM